MYVDCSVSVLISILPVFPLWRVISYEGNLSLLDFIISFFPRGRRAKKRKTFALDWQTHSRENRWAYR
jgi:hypothetical protein